MHQAAYQGVLDTFRVTRHKFASQLDEPLLASALAKSHGHRSPDEIAALSRMLRATRLLQTVAVDTLSQIVSQMSCEVVPAQHVIFRQGEPSTFAFWVISGSASEHVREPGEPNDEIGANLVQALGKCRRLAIASDCFGLFGGTRGPCLSSAVAREKAVLAKIAVTNMQTILRTLSNRCVKWRGGKAWSKWTA